MADAHAHLHWPGIELEALGASQPSQNSPALILAASVSPRDWLELDAFLKARVPLGPRILTALGLHPGYDDLAFDPAELDLPSPGPQAIGEIGLDRRVSTPLKTQQSRFEAMLALAQGAGLPVVIHQTGPWDLFFESLDRYPGLAGLVHGFNASLEIATQLIERGFYLSIGTRLLDPRAKRLREVLGSLGLERLLLESDAPEGYRLGSGVPNQPSLVGELARELANLLGVSPSRVARETTANLTRLLGLEGEF